MTFKRNWDDSCPREWDRWEQDGATYVIQDLPPEDDEEALKILVEELLRDELLFSMSDICNDPESVQSISGLWRNALERRMSLACYAVKDGRRKLVAVNVCIAKEKEEKDNEKEKKAKMPGEKWNNVSAAFMYAEGKAKSLEALGLELALTAYGLVVLKDYRGAKLGYKVIAAREPMCRFLGINGSTTIFTSVAAQKSAARAGFESIAEVPIKELAAIGLDYPENDESVIKVMIKKYD